MTQKTKIELEKEVGRLKEQLKASNKVISNEESLKKDVVALNKKLEYSARMQEQLDFLITENKKLKSKQKDVLSKESYVGVRSISKTNTWLPSPESQMDSTRSNDGRMLKPGQSTIIPSYWMVHYIGSKNTSFLMGDVCCDNVVGKKINPNLKFVELDLPAEFVEAALTPEEINLKITAGSEALMEFIEKYSDKKHILQKIYGGVLDHIKIVTRDQVKASYEFVASHIESILYPTPKEEKGGKE